MIDYEIKYFEIKHSGVGLRCSLRRQSCPDKIYLEKRGDNL